MFSNDNPSDNTPDKPSGKKYTQPNSPLPHRTNTNIAASVRARLLNLAKARNENFDFLLNRYASERLLYRLGQSPHAPRFILKGATLFALWSDTPHRPTRDLDLLGSGEASVSSIASAFREIATLPVEDDGLYFDPNTVVGQTIKEEEEYEGVRVRMIAMLQAARIPLQIDIGFGDAVTPAPTEIEFPTLLGQSAPRLRAYPRETVLAEKLEAMVKLGQNNSRMKDFHDVWVLLRAKQWDQAVLHQAIHATFSRRQTPFPATIPLALGDEFGNDSSKVVQWNAFCRKNTLTDAPPWATLIQELRTAMWPLLKSLTQE